MSVYFLLSKIVKNLNNNGMSFHIYPKLSELLIFFSLKESLEEGIELYRML